MLRHEKPFHCKVTGCPRSREGFGTKNDLDRHKRSVHSDLSVSGPRYVCRHAPCNTKDPAKIWPRADNFRSHLHRVHKLTVNSEDDMDDYIYRYVLYIEIPMYPISHSFFSQPQDQVPLRQELQGVGTAVTGPATEPGSLTFPTSNTLSFDQSFLGNQALNARPRRAFPDLQESLNSLLPKTIDSGASNLEPVNEDEEIYIQPDILSETVPHSAQASPALGDDLLSLPELSQQTPPPNDEDAINAHVASVSQNDPESLIRVPSLQEIEEEQVEDNISVCSRDSDSDSDSSEPESSDVRMVDEDSSQTTSSPVYGSVAQALSRLNKDDPKMLEILKALPKKLLEDALKSGSMTSSSDNSSRKFAKNKNQHLCSDCSKPFNRPCELKYVSLSIALLIH